MADEGQENVGEVSWGSPNENGSTNSLHILKYSLPGVLHFLQMEFRKFEVDRYEWEIERAVLKAKLEKAEGEVKGMTSLQGDMLRRIKMLEFALKQERQRCCKDCEQPKRDSTDISLDQHGEDPVYSLPPDLREPNIVERTRELLQSYLQEVVHLTSDSFRPASVPEPKRTALAALDPAVYEKKPASQLLQNEQAFLKKKSNADTLTGSIASLSVSPSANVTLLGTSPANDGLASLTLTERDIQEDSGDASVKGRRKDFKKVGASVSDSPGDKPLWSTCGILRYHLDVVRAIAWIPGSMYLCTGSDDGLVRVWDVHGTNSFALGDVHPLLTLRHHAGPVSAVTTARSDDAVLVIVAQGRLLLVYRLLVSQLTDKGTIEPSPPQELIGHSDMIWDVATQPVTDGEASITLASASADGSVKLWRSRDFTKFGLTQSISYPEQNVSLPSGMLAPCAVRWDLSDPNTLWLAYRSRLVASYDVIGQSFRRLLRGDTLLNSVTPTSLSEEKLSVEPETQLYSFSLHPSLPLLIMALGDRSVRLWHRESGELIHSMIAHGDAVTSVDFHPTGSLFATGSHDRSLRLWTLPVAVTESNDLMLIDPITCVQESTCHRLKFDESILSARFSDTVSFSTDSYSVLSLMAHSCKLATAGADGIVKIHKPEGSSA